MRSAGRARCRRPAERSFCTYARPQYSRPGGFGVAKKKIVHVRDKRRALPAQRDVGWAKVADGGDARSGSDDSRLGDLKGRGGGLAEKGDGAALMEDRLAVAADQRDARW